MESEIRLKGRSNKKPMALIPLLRFAKDKVVVIPLMVDGATATGDATEEDVLEGKTFSYDDGTAPCIDGCHYMRGQLSSFR